MKAKTDTRLFDAYNLCKIKYYLLCKFIEYIKSAHFDMNAFFYILFSKISFSLGVTSIEF